MKVSVLSGMIRLLVSVLVLVPVLAASSAFAVTTEEKGFLSLYFTDDELKVVSATRSLKSIDRIAENISVVTKEDIELMNAHTLAEALYNVTGLESYDFAGPGSPVGSFGIHGADYTHTAVFLDGVLIQNVSQGFEYSSCPVQMVERIEIIKGPASAAWGSSFGGVINIITKSVGPGNHIGGTLYGSVGERSTSDARAELFGRKGPVGLYLFAGTLNSDGLVRGHEFWHNNLFSKVTIDAGSRSKIDISFLYHKSDSQVWDFLEWGWDAYDAWGLERLYGRAALSSSLTPHLDLNLSAFMYKTNDIVYENSVSTEQRYWDALSNFSRYGASGNITWRAGNHVVVTGTDLFHEKLTATGEHASKRDKYAFYANDTITLDSFTVTPGLRYDHSSIGGSILSPSLGVTWLATKDILVRALVSRGFQEPRIDDAVDGGSSGFVGNSGIRPEKIWSYEAGVEANLFNALRAKLTLFYHDIDDLFIDEDLGGGSWTRVNGGKARTTGGEFELSTKEYKGFKAKAGIHYENVKLRNFETERAFDTTKAYGFNTAVSYTGHELKAIVQGHYMWWNLPLWWEAKYNGFVVDFNVIKEIIKTKEMKLEAFFTGHNMLKAASNTDILVPNPGRWIEAGMRLTF